MPNSAAPLVSVERAGVEEAIHLGHLAVVGADGQVRARLGDPDHLTYFRSCAKPFQSVGSLGTGIAGRFDLRPEHVAIMSASHNGEPRHVEIVRDLLARTGVPESALQCGAHGPIPEPSAALARPQMDGPPPIFDKCAREPPGVPAAAHAPTDRESGFGLHIKLDSGDGTWTAVAVMAALDRLGWLRPGEREALSAFARPTLRNHRRMAVGIVRPVLQFAVTAM